MFGKLEGGLNTDAVFVQGDPLPAKCLNDTILPCGHVAQKAGSDQPVSAMAAARSDQVAWFAEVLVDLFRGGRDLLCKFKFI